MRLLVLLLTSLAVLVAAGCAGGDDGGEDATPARTTPQEIRLAVFERSYSECATYSLERLALTHGVDATPGQVSTAVAEAWAKRFGGGPDAVRSGKSGCLQGIRDR